jgi:hypothetical protein
MKAEIKGETAYQEDERIKAGFRERKLKEARGAS